MLITLEVIGMTSFCCSRQFIGNLQSGVLFSGIALNVGGKFAKREEGSPDLVASKFLGKFETFKHRARSRSLSSAEAFLCRREAGEKEKEIAFTLILKKTMYSTTVKPVYNLCEIPR